MPSPALYFIKQERNYQQFSLSVSLAHSVAISCYSLFAVLRTISASVLTQNIHIFMWNRNCLVNVSILSQHLMMTSDRNLLIELLKSSQNGNLLMSLWIHIFTWNKNCLMSLTSIRLAAKSVIKNVQKQAKLTCLFTWTTDVLAAKFVIRSLQSRMT